MNSEPWREIWLEQPVAPPPIPPDRFLTQIRAEAAAWEEEWARGERQALIAPLWMLALSALNYWSEPWLWSHAIAQASLVVWMGIMLWLREQRRQVERQFGTSVRERLDRVRAMLRQRLRWSGVARWMIAPLAVAIGLMPIEMADASPWVGVGVGLAALVWMVWWFAIDHGRESARIRQRLATVEAACASLVPRDHT